MKNRHLTILTIIVLAGSLAVGKLAASDTVEEARLALSQQALADRVWLYEMALARPATEDSDRLILRSYSRFLFQIFELRELLNDQSDFLNPVIKMIGICSLTRRIEEFEDDPLGLRNFYEAGFVQGEEFTHYIGVKPKASWADYQAYVQQFKGWLAPLKVGPTMNAR